MRPPKRPKVEPPEDWRQLRLLLRWPEHVADELIRPVVLYGETATERARATGEQERAIDWKADRFDARGMLGLFPAERREPVQDPPSLPFPLRQCIVDLRAEAPAMSLPETPRSVPSSSIGGPPITPSSGCSPLGSVRP